MTAAGGGRVRRRRIDLAGGPAAVLTLGAGRPGTPVLLLHGFAGDLLTWQFLAPALAAARPVVAVDLPGHGGSTLEVGGGAVSAFAPWLVAVLDALDLPRVHVVGHSMGGLVALHLARHAPGRVGALSLIAPAGLGAGVDRDLLARLPLLADGAAAAACAERLFGGPSPLAGRTAEVLLAQAADPERRAALTRILAASFPAGAGPAPVDWRGLDRPLQILWGDRDAVIPPPPPARLPPGVPVHWIEGAGHLPQGERPAAVGAALLGFLAAADREGEMPWLP